MDDKTFVLGGLFGLLAFLIIVLVIYLNHKESKTMSQESIKKLSEVMKYA